MLTDALQHIDQIGMRIDAVQTAGDDQACTMPTCVAPRSVQQKFQFSLPIGIIRRGRLRWLVSIGTSGSMRKTSSRRDRTWPVLRTTLAQRPA